MPIIQHVTREIPPAKLDECISFYGLLGFGQVTPPEGIRDHAVWLERSRDQIHLVCKPDACPETGHVGLVIEDYEATLTRLRSAGHEIDPRREHWGSPRSFVRDPAGHLVELMAWGPSDGPSNA